MKIPGIPFGRKKRKSLGQEGESAAAQYLRKNGFEILATNYRNPKGLQLGEIDIVAKNKNRIVFVEVKTRRGSPENTFPEENLTPGKLRKVERIAIHYLQSNGLQDEPYQFDAITILFGEDGIPHIRHFEHIFA